MATEILRPILVTNRSFGYVELVATPESSDIASYHLLIDEVVADDDATYLTTTSTMPFGILFDSIELRKRVREIKSIKFVLRLKVDSSTTKVFTCVHETSLYENGNKVIVALGSIDDDVKQSFLLDSVDWSVLSVTYDGPTIRNFITTNITNHPDYPPLALGLYVSSTSSSSKSAASVDVTQAYAEITYDDGTVKLEAIYLKENKKLDADQIKEIHEFMKSKPKISGFEGIFDTNWELACMLWDMNNEKYKIPKDAKMPDYLQLR